jgi:hypothetical protein
MRIRWEFLKFPGFGLQLGTEFLDNLGRLLFLILFCGCTIFCLLLWWWPNAGRCSPKHGNPRNAHRISLTVLPSFLQSTEFLDNMVLLLFPMLFRMCAIIYLLLWWWPKAPSNGQPTPRPRYAKTVVDHEISLIYPTHRPTQSRPGLLQKSPLARGPWTCMDCVSQTRPGRGQAWPGRTVETPAD